MPTPYETALHEGARLTSVVDWVFGQIGTAEHPRGSILTLYRNAVRALRGSIVRGEIPLPSFVEVMDQLQKNVRDEATRLIETSAKAGIKSGQAQLSTYGIKPSLPESASLASSAPQRAAAVKAATSEVVRQTNVGIGMIASHSEIELLLGTPEQTGLIRPNNVSRDIAFWATLAMMEAVGQQFDVAGGEYRKQAVATIKGNTTETCLQVHGQVQPVDGKFVLVGHPRYADEMEWSPFHPWCRTSIVLYLERYDFGLTRQMEGRAQAELTRRANLKKGG